MIATFVFGIVPATLLVPWVLLLGLFGVGVMLDFGEPGALAEGLAASAAAVLGMLGYVALFDAARVVVTPKVARRLAGGIVANLFGIWLFVPIDLWQLVGSAWFVLVSPLVVGVAHLARFVAR